MIDQGGNSRLADFGLITIRDSATNSCEQGGSTRWMSPECLDPGAFGFKDGRQTKASDCYALGMVVYEVLSGRIPFYQFSSSAAISKVSRGERPERPQGAEGRWFTGEVWDILERCWKPDPSDRPSIDCVLECLDKASKSWTPSSFPVVGPQVVDQPTWTWSN